MSYIPDSCDHEIRAYGECCPTADMVCWNAMVYPIIELPTSGVLFYQGEANLFNPENYQCLFPAFVEMWRNSSFQNDLMFITFTLTPLIIQRGYLEVFREVQFNFEKQIDNLFIVNTIDLGDYLSPFGDLHPRKKEDAGKRAKDIALKHIYHQNIFANYPEFLKASSYSDGMNINVKIEFKPESIGRELVLLPQFQCPDNFYLDNLPLYNYCSGFEIEFDDGLEVPAINVMLDDDNTSVLVVIPIKKFEITTTIVTRVSYAYSGYPQAILFNSFGYPALPFWHVENI